MTDTDLAVPDRPTDEEILKYERAIKEAETLTQPLVSDVLDFSSLFAQYETGLPIFKEKIKVKRQ